MHDLGVIYLYRAGEGEAPASRFLASYNKHQAGVPHDLHVIFKGFPDKLSLQTAKVLFNDIPFNSIEINDSYLDIGAYRYAAAVASNQRLIFLNTFSQILAPNWAAHLDRALSQPGVGIAGATGSWQSNTSGYERELKLLFYKFKNLPDGLRALCRPARLDASDDQPTVNDVVTGTWRRPRRSIWKYVGAPLQYFLKLYEFGRYPNPHIRTNAFLIERHRFLALRFPESQTKANMYKFESGRRSLTKQIIEQGLRPVVVDRHGNLYDIAAWNSSGTFWSGDQINLLVSDNRSDDYANGSHEFREALENSAWVHPWQWKVNPLRASRSIFGR